MRECLTIDVAPQSIQGEHLNNTSKLIDINKRIKGDTKKLEEIESDPRRGAGGFSPKDEGWLYMLANALKRLAGKIVEAVKAIVVSVLGAILSFLKKTVGFVAEHTWAPIAFTAELVGVWLMQKVRKS